MAVSANFHTPDRIIRAAMENAGILADGQDPTPEQYAKYLPRLNDLVNFYQTKGIKLWLNRMMPLSLVAGTSTYTISPREMRVLEGYYFDSNQLSRPLRAMSWNEWNLLPDHTSQGPVNGYFIDKQITVTGLHLWQVPDTQAATGSCQFLVQDPIVTFVQLNDNLQAGFPPEWYIALHWGLADEICTGQPQEIIVRCQAKAAQYLEALEGWDVEDASTQFQPDAQSKASKFR